MENIEHSFVSRAYRPCVQMGVVMLVLQFREEKGYQAQD